MSAADLALELGVSTRTVYRDVQVLSARGLPVLGAPGLGYILGSGGFLPPLTLVEGELDAVVLGLRWVEKRADPELARAAADALAKVYAILPEHLRGPADAPRVFVGPGLPVPSSSVDLRLFRDAVKRRVKLDFSYTDRLGEHSRRVVWPLGLAFMEESRFVIGYCELRGAFRHFRLDRIAWARPSEPFAERRTVLLRRWREQLTAEQLAADARRQERVV